MIAIEHVAVIAIGTFRASLRVLSCSHSPQWPGGSDLKHGWDWHRGTVRKGVVPHTQQLSSKIFTSNEVSQGTILTLKPSISCLDVKLKALI